MPSKQITIYDLAQELKVSPGTVSRALKNHFSIGKETTQAVQDLAVKWGYQPNSVASNLRKQKTNSIGVLIPWINRPFISSAISGIEEVAHAAGYTVVIAQSNDSAKKEIANARTLFGNRVDGLIVSLAKDTLDYQHFQAFQDQHIPIVFFDRVSETTEATKIIIDNFKAAFEATEHLIFNGYTRIAHLGGSQSRAIYRDRLQGYKEAFLRNNLPVEEELILINNLTPEDGEKSMAHFLRLPNPPDAIFSANDGSAVSAIQYLKKTGLRVPHDMAVVGFNNDPVSLIIEPALTTVHHPAFEMGQVAAKECLMQISSPELIQKGNTITLETKLIIRSSSSAAVKPKLSITKI